MVPCNALGPAGTKEPDWTGTHQQVDALLASQGSVLHPLAARRQDVLALAGRGLHVGQAEGAQVLHALLHLQLVALARWKTDEGEGENTKQPVYSLG